MKKIIAALLTAACYLSVAAQQPAFEYGKPGELYGLTKVFVDTGPDLATRNNIIKEIKKKLPDLVFTDTADDAEVFLVFGSGAETYLSGVTTTPIVGTDVKTSTPQYRTVENATAYVATMPGDNRVRILMNFKDSRSTVFERKTSTNFARAFVRAYQAAIKERAELEKNPYYRMMTGKDKKPNQ